MGEISLQTTVWNLLAVFGAFRLLAVLGTADVREGFDKLFDLIEWFVQRLKRLWQRFRD